MRMRRLPLGIAVMGFIGAMLAGPTGASAGWQGPSSFGEVACGLARFAGQAYSPPGPGPHFGYGPPSCWPRVVEHRVRVRAVRVIKVRG
jgi:hypothetical protein